MADINETQVKITVNGKEAEDELKRLREKADDLRKSMLEAYRTGNNEAAKAFKKELRDTEQQLRKNESGVKAVTRVMNQLNRATPSELNKALKHLQSELKTIERGTPAWDAHVRKIRLVKAEMDKVNAEMRQSESLLVRMRNGVQNWGTMAAGAVAALSGIVLAGKKAVSAYAEMQQEEANVRKYTGMTEEEVTHLNEAFKKMDTRTSRSELNKLAQEAGRLGMQSEEDVLGFVRAADKINVALDDLGEGATLTLSKLTDIFGDRQRLGTERSLLAVGSVINELSQNCTASAPYLAEFAQRLAGVGAQAGMSVPEIMGFGAVLDANGQKVEMSATALSKVIMNMFKSPEKIAKATGMSIEQFAETCKRSTNEGLMMLLDRLHELGGIDSLAPVFADMGENGARASAVLAALAGNVDMVRQQQEAANVAFQEAISIDKEFAVQNETVQARLEKARKGFTEMAVTLGKELMPVVSKVISGTSMTMRVMLNTIQFVKEHRSALVALAAAVATYTVAVNLALIKEKVHAAVVAVKTAAMHVHKVAVLAASAAYNALTGNTVRANAAMKLLNKTMLLNPWAALVAAVVGLGTAFALVIKHRNEMSLQDKTIADAQKEINQQYTEQRSKIDLLNDTLHDEKLSLNARRKALEELKAIVPDYHASLTDEGKLINDNADAIDNYTAALEKQIQLQVYQEKLTELYKRKMEAEQNLTDSEAALVKAQQDASDHAGEVQMRTSMGAAGPTGGFENSYSVAVRVRTENVEGAKKELEEIKSTIETIKGKVQDGGLLGAATSGTQTPSSSSATPAMSGGGDGKAPLKENKEQYDDALKALEEWKKKEQAVEDLAYAKGDKTHSQHVEKNKEIEKEYHERRLSLMEEGSAEYYQEQANWESKLRKDNNAKSLKDQDAFYAEEKRCLDEQYMDGKINHEQYTRALEDAELDYMDNVVRIYKEGSEEYIKAQENFRKKEHEIQKKRFDERKKVEDNIKKLYFTKGAQYTSDKEEYDKQSAALDVVREQLRNQATTNEERLAIEKAYQEAKYLLAKEYNQKEVMETMDAWRAAGDEIMKFLESDLGKNMAKGFGGLVGQMSSLFSALTDNIKQDTDRQVKDIEDAYQQEVDAGGKSNAELLSLEQKKNADIANVKSKAAKKEFAMRVIETVATGIQSAVSAFAAGWDAGMAGVVLGPLFMAMSLATTGVQIAALKKQQEMAASTGYAEGGYTPKGRKYEPVGIVHAGEWVASQELLANPTAAAAIAQLDEAQRNNTIGLLRPAKTVSSANEEGTARQRIAESYERNTGGANIGESIERLNRTLDNGIYAATLMTGDKGLIRQQRKYEQLIRNKSGK